MLLERKGSKMVKYRIKIERAEGKYKHIKNIMIETEDIKETIEKILISIKEEKERRDNILAEKINNREKMIEKVIKQAKEREYDLKSKGNDITEEEFIQNEIWHETRG